VRNAPAPVAPDMANAGAQDAQQDPAGGPFSAGAAGAAPDISHMTQR
jgi:hypothetical protein